MAASMLGNTMARAGAQGQKVFQVDVDDASVERNARMGAEANPRTAIMPSDEGLEQAITQSGISMESSPDQVMAFLASRVGATGARNSGPAHTEAPFLSRECFGFDPRTLAVGEYVWAVDPLIANRIPPRWNNTVERERIVNSLRLGLSGAYLVPTRVLNGIMGTDFERASTFASLAFEFNNPREAGREAAPAAGPPAAAAVPGAGGLAGLLAGRGAAAAGAAVPAAGPAPADRMRDPIKNAAADAWRALSGYGLSAMGPAAFPFALAAFRQPESPRVMQMVTDMHCAGGVDFAALHGHNKAHYDTYRDADDKNALAPHIREGAHAYELFTVTSFPPFDTLVLGALAKRARGLGVVRSNNGNDQTPFGDHAGLIGMQGPMVPSTKQSLVNVTIAGWTPDAITYWPDAYAGLTELGFVLKRPSERDGALAPARWVPTVLPAFLPATSRYESDDSSAKGKVTHPAYSTASVYAHLNSADGSAEEPIPWHFAGVVARSRRRPRPQHKENKTLIMRASGVSRGGVTRKRPQASDLQRFHMMIGHGA